MSRLITLSVALLVLVPSGLLGIGTALGQLGDTASPAQGHASVIAQGVATLGGGELGWRVTRASPPQQTEATPRDNPGFLLADEGAVLVTLLDTDAQARLAAGEATFLPTGAQQQDVALDGGPASYYRIDLVAASEVNTAGNDELLFIGEPFASPGGSRDLDLVRDVLAADEVIELQVTSPVAPTLLFVTSGTVELVPAGNDAATPVPLPAGQGAALSGNVIVRAAGGAGATFVTAVIGPDVQPGLAQGAAPTATPLPAPATLAMQALACPSAYEGADFAADCAEPLADITFDLSSATGATAQGTTGGDGSLTFVELIPDTYSLTGSVPGELANQVVACADAAGSVPSEASQALIPGVILTFEAGDAVTCQWFVIPEDLRGEGEGTIAVTVHFCPGTPIDPYADCTLGDATGAVIDGPVVLTTDASSAVPVSGSDPALVWGAEGGVPLGTYFLQPGGIAAPEGYEVSEVRGSVGGSGNGWTFVVDEANPNAALDLIYVPAGQPQGDTDADRDGLTDAQEAQIGTDPANPDTDEDGLFDGPELAVGTDPTLYDTDGDGFGDNQEAVNGSDPFDPASVPEGDPGIDTDGDMLTDAEEEELGTNAATPDTDGDGLTDFAEVGFEPGSSTGTDPLVFDTDGDGVGEGDEVANGTDPTDPASA